MEFDYKDMSLQPNLGTVSTRDGLDTSFKLGNYTFDVPVIPANMPSIMVSKSMAISIATQKNFYIMHRFNIDNIDFVQSMQTLGLYASISIGVTKEYYELIDNFVTLNICPEFITIDIAHGHSLLMRDMLKYVKERLPNSFIIAGNICTRDAVIDLTNWGADALKVGVSGGMACTTAHNTGVGNRGFQASMVKDLCSLSTLPIIADGSIVYPGDISKAINLGATTCMAGSLFAGLVENSLLDENNETIYYGSASEFNNGKSNRIEGTSIKLPFKDKTLKQQFQFIKESIQSTISYSGGNKLSDIRNMKYKLIK
jgi:GMP reductase